MDKNFQNSKICSKNLNAEYLWKKSSRNNFYPHTSFILRLFSLFLRVFLSFWTTYCMYVRINMREILPLTFG